VAVFLKSGLLLTASIFRDLGITILEWFIPILKPVGHQSTNCMDLVLKITIGCYICSTWIIVL